MKGREWWKIKGEREEKRQKGREEMIIERESVCVIEIIGGQGGVGG